MRIAIDTRSLRPPLTGIGHYVLRLTNAMLPLFSADEELLSFNGLTIDRLDQHFLGRIEALNSKQASGGAALPAWWLRDKAYAFLRQIYPIRSAVRALCAARLSAVTSRFDLFHAVNYFPPARLHKPFLPIIYDLSCIRLPEAHPRARINSFTQGLKLLADAPFVQTISEFSKSEIVTLLNISPDRVHVTYPGLSGEFRSDGEADDVHLAKYNVERHKYFLVLGTREPRKNFKTVAQAHMAMPATIGNGFPLLWVGASGWGDLLLSPAIVRAKEMGRIRFIGYIPDRDLAVLYRHTVLFMMPSVYEGFGMPVIEALACGAPVALSKIPVFQEIAASYARFVDPMDVEGWRQAMEESLAEVSNSSGQRGPQRDLARFSWNRGAATTLDLFRRLV